MNPTVEELRAARALISSPANWTQGALMRDKDGYSISAYEHERDGGAQSFCMAGAIVAVMGTKREFSLNSTLERALYIDSRRLLTIPSFNDHATHADVLRVYDIAITLAEKTQYNSEQS